MVMRHQGGLGISPTALKHSNRHNLCRISRVSTRRLICKTNTLSPDSMSLWGQTFSRRMIPTMKKILEPPSGHNQCMKKQAFADKSPGTDPTYGPEVMPMTVLKFSRWNSSTTLITHNHAFFTTYFSFRPIWGRKARPFNKVYREYVGRTKKVDWPIWVRKARSPDRVHECVYVKV